MLLHLSRGEPPESAAALDLAPTEALRPRVPHLVKNTAVREKLAHLSPAPPSGGQTISPKDPVNSSIYSRGRVLAAYVL